MIKWLQYTKEEEGCLIWTRCFNSDGYPRAFINGNVNGKVHRQVFYEVNGYFPKVVRHVCDNPKCINPDHLIEGDNLANISDRHERQRTHNQVKNLDYENCLNLRQLGKTYKEIGETLGIKTKRVEYILTRWRKES